ncbi:MAG: hydroxymethylbilane synthase [Conexivisphaera sp.]
MRVLRIASRSSALSLAQVDEVVAPLRAYASVEVLKVLSRGDVDLRTPLYAMEEKGVFERDVDAAVLRGEADAAVHSAKDVPTDIPPGLVLAAVPRRRSPYDALVAPGGAALSDLPPGSRVGTSSLRRISMLRRVRPDLEVLPIRGNLDTRLGALGGRVDALVVAEAGLERIGFRGAWRRLPPEDFVPAAGQGALMVLAREGDSEVIDLLSRVDDPVSRAEVQAEKSFVSAIGAGCRAPVGVLARVQGSTLAMVAAVVPPEGSGMVLVRASGNLGDDVVGELVDAFRSAGGPEAMRGWRDAL